MALTAADRKAIAKIIAETLAAVPTSAPASQRAESPRTFATKAERAAGNGFSCKCGRNDLRTAPTKGKWHKTPDGEKHEI